MLSRRYSVPVLVVVLAVALMAAACGGGEEAPAPPTPTPTSALVAPTPTPTLAPVTIGPGPVCEREEGLSKAEYAVVSMAELNNSGQSGCVEFRQVELQTRIVVDVTAGSSEDDPQPVQIYEGRCGDLKDVKWVLEGAVGGQSTSFITIEFAIIQFGQYALAISRSEAEEGVIVSCGNLPTVLSR